jgi:hypothetical protein
LVEYIAGKETVSGKDHIFYGSFIENRLGDVILILNTTIPIPKGVNCIGRES